MSHEKWAEIENQVKPEIENRREFTNPTVDKLDDDTKIGKT